MAIDVEHQLEQYFRWVEARSGSSLQRDPDPSLELAERPISAAQVAEIVALEQQLLHSSKPNRGRRLVLAAVAIAAVLAVVAAGLLTGGDGPAERRSPVAPPVVRPTTNVLEATVVAHLVGPFAPTSSDLAMFRSDGDIVAISTGTCTLIDAVSGEVRTRMTTMASPLISRSGTLGFADRRLWDVNTGEPTFELEGVRPELRGDFSPDGSRLVAPTTAPSGSAEATIFDTKTGEAVAVLSTDDVAITWAMYSPDGSKVMTQGQFGVTRIWDATSGVELLSLTDSDSGSSFSSDGTTVLSIGPSGRVRLRDASTGAQLAVDQPLPADSTARAWFSPDGRTIAITHRNPVEVDQRTIDIIDAQSGALVGQIPAVSNADAPTTAAFRPDGRALVTISPEGVGEIWSATATTKLATLVGAGERLNSVAFNVDGTLIVGLAADGTVLTWEVP